MNSVFSTFLDRLAERFTAILASVVSSRVESLRAEAQAEQQSQLEDLARKYEADGKSSIAQALRERAVRLTTGNLAGDGATVIDLVSAEPLRITGPNSLLNGGTLESLPDAFIVDDEDVVLWVIEFGGGYDTERVQEFHLDCVSRNLPYQLW